MRNELEKFMLEALKEAKKALLIDEVPIGCVIVKDHKIIARGHNQRESKLDPLGHAEIIAIKKASKKLKSWRLEDCDIYVTLEPCLMCAGAIIQSRINKVIFAAYDLKGGAFGSSIDVNKTPNINHHPEVIKEVMLEQSKNMLQDFFKAKRNK